MFSLATIACQSLGGVELSEVATASGKPSNVATLVRVTQQGQPVNGLSAGAFHLSEDGKPLENQSVDLRLLDPVKVAAFHTVLLLDMGHLSSKEDRQQFGEAVSFFLRGVLARQSATVLGFDGSSKTRLLGDFAVDATGAGGDRIEKQLPVKLDPSRDLRGSVVQALDLLDDRLQKSGHAVQIGTLVVFTRGPDVAGRTSPADFEARLSRSKHKMVLVNVVGDRDDAQSLSLAKDGKVQAQAVESLPIAFEQAASAVDKLLGHHYLISYCSPSRAGERRLGVEVQVVSDDLQVQTSDFETRFDASGFTRGCNSNAPPKFNAVPARP